MADKSIIVQKMPFVQKCKAGKYAWCACGMSVNQPWCNGFHKGTNFSPSVFKAEESKTAAMCMCKQTKNPPFCDGSHRGL